VREGCIAETIAAAQVRESAQRVNSDFLKKILNQIADDEERHAALAWRFVRWSLLQYPELASDIQQELNLPPTLADADDFECIQWGILSSAEQNQIALNVVNQVISPCVQALFTTEPIDTTPVA
jgi:hypothetical protein